MRNMAQQYRRRVAESEANALEAVFFDRKTVMTMHKRRIKTFRKLGAEFRVRAEMIRKKEREL